MGTTSFERRFLTRSWLVILSTVPHSTRHVRNPLGIVLVSRNEAEEVFSSLLSLAAHGSFPHSVKHGKHKSIKCRSFITVLNTKRNDFWRLNWWIMALIRSLMKLGGACPIALSSSG